MEKKELEKNLFYKILIKNIQENNAIRKRNFYIKIIFFIFFIYLFSYNFTSYENNYKYHTAVIRIEGEISSSSIANAENIINGIKQAYSNKYVQGIILKINSPGGSPVQSQRVYKEIVRLKKKYPSIPIYSSIQDIGASAAYMIACSTNKIYADEMSIVGSIGVVIDSFGFSKLMEKLGIERRAYTAGKFKRLIDPFSEINDEKLKIINYQLKSIHKEFIKKVINGRKNSLKISPLIFSGLTWTGSDAFNIGLIDGFGDVNLISREIIKSDYIIDYTISRDFFENIIDRANSSINQNYLLLK